jgi:hypothetical protein
MRNSNSFPHRISNRNNNPALSRKSWVRWDCSFLCAATAQAIKRDARVIVLAVAFL